jgi:pimeloyl-ACP methyl ester carboxylesterase
MKKYLLLSFLLVIGMIGFSQNNFPGLWQGTLKVSVDLDLIFHINKNNQQQFSVLVDCPQQGLKGLSASNVTVHSDSIIIEMKQLNGSYQGRLLNDSTISGKWSQGVSLPLNLRRIEKVTEVQKPQTPKPPFPYKSEDILYFNASHKIQYGATITIPQGKGPFPAVLLITGSGQQNRDEEVMGHKPFAIIADYLTKKGFVVLRVDDRGMGQTTGDVALATSADFANDALVSLDYLKNRAEVIKEKIGLMGHSEGGMIAEMIGAKRKDLSFIVLLAAPGESITDLMVHQNEAVLTAAGLPKDYIQPYLGLYRKLASAAANAPSAEAAKIEASKLVEEWTAVTPANIVQATTGIKDEETKQKFIDLFTRQTSVPWFKYFLSYNPAPDLQKISARVLALNGDRDVQVVSAFNLPAIEAALKKSSSPSWLVKQLPGLNHLFQHCTRCTVEEYGQLDESFAPEALEIIGNWLKQNIQQ